MAAEELLLVLEEGVLNVNLNKNGTPVRIRVPPFTLIAATTQPSALSAPLIQRFGRHFRFGFYSTDELRTIISNATERMDVEFDDGVCIELASTLAIAIILRIQHLRWNGGRYPHLHLGRVPSSEVG